MQVVQQVLQLVLQQVLRLLVRQDSLSFSLPPFSLLSFLQLEQELESCLSTILWLFMVYRFCHIMFWFLFLLTVIWYDFECVWVFTFFWSSNCLEDLGWDKHEREPTDDAPELPRRANKFAEVLLWLFVSCWLKSWLKINKSGKVFNWSVHGPFEEPTKKN